MKICNGKLHAICPVLSTSNLERDIAWYNKYVGFSLTYQEEDYALLNRENIWIHLQWHNNNNEDPFYGSTAKIFVDAIQPIFEEMLQRETFTKDKLRLNTPCTLTNLDFTI